MNCKAYSLSKVLQIEKGSWQWLSDNQQNRDLNTGR